jgi:hypothetical protein
MSNEELLFYLKFYNNINKMNKIEDNLETEKHLEDGGDLNMDTRIEGKKFNLMKK